MKTLPELARDIATAAHRGQFRRDGITPCIVHPEAVASRVGTDPKMLAVAWLHDVLEDTDETVESLVDKGIPEEVVASVEILTKSNGVRYDEYLDRVLTDSVARSVKVADMLSNLSDSPSDRQIRKYAYGLLRLVPE